MKRASWRTLLFRTGCGVLLLSGLFYVYAWTTVSSIKPLQRELEVGAHYFLIGSALNLVAFALMMFGHGWKRLPLGLVALIGVLAWNVFTLY
jgi:uncharacterized membrane protein (UPF0136 family)